MSHPSHKTVSRERALRILDVRIVKLQELGREYKLELSQDALKRELGPILIRGLERRHTSIAEDEIIRILKDAHATSPDSALTTGEIKRKLRLPTSPLTILKLMAERGQLKSIKGGRPFQLVRDDATGKLVGSESARNRLYSRIESLAKLANASPAVRSVLRRLGKGLKKFDEASLREVVDLETYNIWMEELHRNGVARGLQTLTPIWFRTSSKWWLAE